MQDFLQILQPVIHYSLHLLVPGLLAWVFFRKKWKIAWLIMIATMLVDLDHLLANPMFDQIDAGLVFIPYTLIMLLLLTF